MASPYGSAPFGPAQLPSPSPLPGNKPTVNLPVDGDAPNSASLYQMTKVNTDFIGYLQTAAQWRPPVVPLAGGSALNKGFTAISHVGTGTFVFSPVGSPNTSPYTNGGNSEAAYNVVIQVTVAGAPGDGTVRWKWSLDGGLTFAAPTAIPVGLYTDAASGFVVNVSPGGTCIQGDTYQYQPADTPQARFVDAAGNTRFAIDHLGFQADYDSEFREDWVDPPSGAIVTGAWPSRPRWVANIVGAGSQALDTQNLNGPIACQKLIMGAGSAAADKSWLYTKQLIGFGGNNLLNLQVAATLSNLGANGFDVSIGFQSANVDMTNTANSGIMFQKLAGDTNWFAVCQTVGSATRINTGIVPATPGGGYDLLRIECCGGSTLWAAAGAAPRIRFFINGVPCGDITTNVPLFAMAIGAQATYNGTASRFLTLGPIRSRNNIFTNPPI